MIHLATYDLTGKSFWVADPNDKQWGASYVTTPNPPGVYCCIFSAYKTSNIEKLGYKILFECRARNMHHLHKEPSNNLHFIIFEIQEENNETRM